MVLERSKTPSEHVVYKATTVLNYNYSPSQHERDDDDTINNNNNVNTTKSKFIKHSDGSNSLGFGPSTTTTTTTTTSYNFPNGSTGRNNMMDKNYGDSRPPFVTTVTRGRFLPSKFDLLVERNFFTFSSRPRPVGISMKQQSYSSTGIRSDLNRASSPPRGIHDYFNLMWDPHVVRGSTVKIPTGYVESSQVKSRPRGEGIEEQKVRKKRSNVVRSRMKASNASVGRSQCTQSPPPVNGRLHTMIQTERHFLEELGAEVTGESSSDATVQTDEIYEMCLLPSISKPPKKFGVDASTQVLPEELFDFETEVEPILDSLVGKIMEQAMNEVIEEEELCAIREQKNRFQEQRRQEEKELRKLQEQKERIDAEKERLKKQLDLEHIFGFENGRSGSGGEGFVYSTSYLLELLPSVLNSLRQEGFLAEFVNHEPSNENDDCLTQVEVDGVIVGRSRVTSPFNGNGKGGGGGDNDDEVELEQDGETTTTSAVTTVVLRMLGTESEADDTSEMESTSQESHLHSKIEPLPNDTGTG